MGKECGAWGVNGSGGVPTPHIPKQEQLAFLYSERETGTQSRKTTHNQTRISTL